MGDNLLTPLSPLFRGIVAGLWQSQFISEPASRYREEKIALIELESRSLGNTR